MNRFYISIAIFFIIFQVFFKAIRWNTIIQIFNRSINLISPLNYTLISHAFGIVTFGRVGEFIKAKYLVDKEKIGYLNSIISVIFDKIFDIITVILFALIGLSFSRQEIFIKDYFISALALYALCLFNPPYKSFYPGF